MANQNTDVADSPEPIYHQIISTYLVNKSVTDTAAKCKQHDEENIARLQSKQRGNYSNK